MSTPLVITQIQSLLESKKWDLVVTSCEDIEIENDGVSDDSLYSIQLFCYLILNDLNAARYLWKRIKKNHKSPSDQLKAVWSIAKLIITGKYSDVYKTVNSFKWDETHQKLSQEFIEKFRYRAAKLISQSYSSINLNQCAFILGLSAPETVEYIKNFQWVLESESSLIYPKLIIEDKEENMIDISNLQSLTSYVVHLEK